MSCRWTKHPSRIHLLAVGLLLWAAPALGQRAADIALKLNPAEVAEIARLVDLAAPNTFVSPPPQAYWDLQTTVSKALQANPDAMRAVLSERRASR
jgi:hypothetical protein